MIGSILLRSVKTVAIGTETDCTAKASSEMTAGKNRYLIKFIKI